MLGKTFYFGLIRKYIIYFGTLFNDININRIAADGTTIVNVNVPLTYAPKDKILARLAADPNIDKQSAINLPRISFEIKNLSYDGSRKLPTLNRNVLPSTLSKDRMKYQYTPVPYNISFSLYIYVKYSEDGTKILEQILPFFTPDLTATLQLIPDMPGTDRDIPIQLNGSVMYQDNYEGSFTARRAIIWQLDFTMKAEFYGPIYTKPIIKFTETNLFSNENETDPVSWIHIQPGLDANGNPTSIAANSIPVANIGVNDDWGFVIDTSGVTISEQ